MLSLLSATLLTLLLLSLPFCGASEGVAAETPLLLGLVADAAVETRPFPLLGASLLAAGPAPLLPLPDVTEVPRASCLMPSGASCESAWEALILPFWSTGACSLSDSYSAPL